VSPRLKAKREVAAFTRQRVVRAVVEVAYEHGAPAATVDRILRRAGVGRRSFYVLFEDRYDAFLAAFDDAVAGAAEHAAPAYESERTWVARTRSGLGALLEFFDREPELAHLCLIASRQMGPRILARRNEVMRELASVIDGGRAHGRDQPSPITAEGMVGGIGEILHRCLLEGRREPLLGLLNPLMAMIVLPYLGPARAQRELTRSTPLTAVRASPRPMATKVKRPARLTYRTVQALDLIAANPGLSNVEVARAAGVTDEGQISRLLARLLGLELVRNANGEHRGMRNAWSVTTAGHELLATVAALPQPRAERRALTAHPGESPPRAKEE
jgi:AcrR family transcriptional regulator